MKNKILSVTVGVCLVGGAGVGYASIFGEENITLAAQLVELIGISGNTYSMLRETREGIVMAKETIDDARRARALVEELSSYTTDRFIDDFKRDVLTTFPDLDYIIKETSAEGLRDWRDSEISSPMGSYELIGRVFGEATKDIKGAQDEGLVKMEQPVLYRFEAAAALTASSEANKFVDASDEDIEVLVEKLDGASKEEAIVLQAKIQAVVAAQNSHMLRLMSLMIRRDGIEDARNYRNSMNSMGVGLEMQKGRNEMVEVLGTTPPLMTFEDSWRLLE